MRKSARVLLIPGGESPVAGKGLSQVQRRALGIRRQADGYPAPGPSTFWRLMAHLNADALEKIFLQVQAQIRGPAPPADFSPSGCHDHADGQT
jgi:hypothetical protein